MKYFLFSVLTFLIPPIASAASITLTPQSFAVAPGQSFTLAVIANPASSTITSIRANISYDATILQETWLDFAPGWLVVSEPGYDAIDNTNGVVIKTAGYPGGITRPTQLGVVTFRARTPGRAVVLIAGDTLMLDNADINQFSGNSGAAVVQIQGVLHHSAPNTPVTNAGASSLTATAALAPTPKHLLPSLFSTLKHLFTGH